MQRFEYAARLERADDGITVRFRDLPEAITGGSGEQDALEQAMDCLDEAIAARIAAQLLIPAPTKRRAGERLVAVPALTAAKAALYLALKEAGWGPAEASRHLGVHAREVRRMLDPRHPTELPRITAALAALGRRLVIGIEAA